MNGCSSSRLAPIPLAMTSGVHSADPGRMATRTCCRPMVTCWILFSAVGTALIRLKRRYPKLESGAAAASGPLGRGARLAARGLLSATAPLSPQLGRAWRPLARRLPP